MPKLDHATALQRCATDLGHSPTRSEYVRWRRLEQPRSVPSDQRIALGTSWLEVLADVGLEPRSHRLGDAEVWRVVAEARRVLGAPSTGEYGRLSCPCVRFHLDAEGTAAEQGNVIARP